jgi:hypothetical protein
MISFAGNVIAFQSYVPPLLTDESAGLMLDDDAVGMTDPMGFDKFMIDVGQDLRQHQLQQATVTHK